MKIVFMGTPDFSVATLEKLIEKHDVVGVYTRAPKESGRGKKVNKTPIHLLAESKGIEVRTPKTLRDKKEQDTLRAYGADAIIVAAYGLLLPKEVLDMPKYGCINVHASLLPRWRGAAPIQRAIEFGDKKSGVSIMQMVEELDAGDVLSSKEIVITNNMTGENLHDELSRIGADLLIETLDSLDTSTPLKQDDNLVCYAKKISKDECLIDFNQNAEIIERKIRAFAPYPGMFFMYNDERFKVFETSITERVGEAGLILEGTNNLIIATKDKALMIKRLQRQGKQPMNISDLLRGFNFKEGYKL